MKSRKFSALCGALVAAVLVFQGSGLAQVRKPVGVSAITPAAKVRPSAIQSASGHSFSGRAVTVKR